jgi:YidC/Oxa1 family membrane protein insertase
MNDQKNLIIAIVASVLIMMSFQFFYEKPKIDKMKQQQAQSGQLQSPGASRPPAVPGQAPTNSQGATPQAAAPQAQIPGAPRTQVPNTPAAPSAPAGKTAPAAPAKAVIAGPRVKFENARISGSIALTGAAIDDVVLKGYRETTKASSDNIRLFAPSSGASGYYAEYGWVPSDPNLRVPGADTVWTASATNLAPGRPVTLSWNNGQGLVFTRTIAIDDSYMFTVTQRVENKGAAAVTLTPYALVNRTGTPPTLGFYILHEGPLGVFDGKLEEVKYNDLAEARQIAKTSTGGWIGITDKYWLAALVPADNSKINSRFLHWKAGTIDKYQVDFTGEARALAPGTSIESKSNLFSGAKEVRVLDGYSKSIGIKNFDLAIDFGWFYFLTKPFFYLLDVLFKFFGNFGLAILAVTVLVKLLFFPLANKSYKSMNAMKKLQPKMQELRDRYGSDRQRLNQEVMELYRREKVNPAASCLPVLIQIPVFFALYKVLFVSIEMRHAPFYGWVHDLSAPDPTSFINLFGLLPFTVPGFIPDFISIGAWPIIMGVLMFLQMKLNPPPPDPVQAKIFMFMPVFFTFIMAPFPAGLVIYWAWNNLLSIAQQWYIMKAMEKADAKAKKG